MEKLYSSCLSVGGGIYIFVKWNCWINWKMWVYSLPISITSVLGSRHTLSSSVVYNQVDNELSAYSFCTDVG